MNQEVKSGKILSPSTPWTERQVPGIQVANEQQSLKATSTEPTIECPECHALVTRTAIAFNAYVCPSCDEHLRMKARDRLTWFFDQVDAELGQEFSAKDPLKFVDSKPYPERMREAQSKTGETEALVVMQGTLNNVSMIACAFEFDFMGGSMGTVVGDRFVQAAERAIEQKQAFDLFCCIRRCAYARRYAVAYANGAYFCCNSTHERCWSALYRCINSSCIWWCNCIIGNAW
ncbi:acetyl-CoA carboxylase beta subunit [Acinetobacter baylyi]|nr:acetyl-CoA carboxylase beta subunit [Acinetobacter baylyi]